VDWKPLKISSLRQEEIAPKAKIFDERIFVAQLADCVAQIALSQTKKE